MGLGFEINGANVDASWSCTGFGRFRKRLAASIGISLDEMWGHGGKRMWKEFKGEPLVPFLNHSDCDGKLTSSECAKIVPRLREILSRAEFAEDVYGYDLKNGLDLVKGMEEAVRLGKPLIFC